MQSRTTSLEAIGRVEEVVDLEALARRELPRVERLLLRILGPRQDLEDLVQAVFVELCRGLPSFRGDAALSTFVGSITVNVARRAMRRSAFFTRRRAMPLELQAHDASPEEKHAQRHALERVRSSLEGLSAVKRIAFTLWAFEGLSVAAIAELMSASPAATKARVFAAQRELRRQAERDPVLRELLGASS